MSSMNTRRGFPIKRSYYQSDKQYVEAVEARYGENSNSIPSRVKKNYLKAKKREAQRVAQLMRKKMLGTNAPSKPRWENSTVDHIRGFKIDYTYIEALVQSPPTPHYTDHVVRTLDGLTIHMAETGRITYIKKD